MYNLDAWLSMWNLETHQVHIDVPEDSILIAKAEYSVVYARTSKEKHFRGTLVLSKKSLEIFDAGRSLDISFAVKEITEVSVHTPWEMTILQQSIRLKLGALCI